jgi:hypothetical protein
MSLTNSEMKARGRTIGWLASAVLLALVAATACTDMSQRRPTRTFLDVHHCGPGKLTLGGVADAHVHDLAVEGEFGVHYERYWVDEASGTIYCLVHAPSADAATDVHRKAHGLVADELHEVVSSARRYQPTPGMPLFVARLGVGDGAAAAGATTEALGLRMGSITSGPRCLEYWGAPGSDSVFALVEAANAEAAATMCREIAGVRSCEVLPVAPGR